MNWWIGGFGIGVPILGLIVWFAWPTSTVDKPGSNGPHRYTRGPDVPLPKDETVFIERSPLAGRDPPPL